MRSASGRAAGGLRLASTWVRVAALAVAAALLVAGCGGGARPDSYVGRASNAALYVTWTRSDSRLSGQLTQALADNQTGTVKTTRASFDGTIDGSSVSLRVDQGLGLASTITGSRDGDTLALDYPGANGGVVTVRLLAGDGADFNQALSVLRDQAVEAKRAADRAAARRQAREDAAQLADSVRAGMNGLDRAADDASATAPDLYASDLDTLRSDLENVKSSYQVLTAGVANGYGTVCDDAATVDDAVGIMRQDLATLRREVSDNRDPGVLNRDIRSLRSQFAQLQSLDPSLLPADAPTAGDLGVAIRAARSKVRHQGGRGAGFDRASALLDDAAALQVKGDAACQRRGD
jgi:hypothetical protein